MRAGMATWISTRIRASRMISFEGKGKSDEANSILF